MIEQFGIILLKNISHLFFVSQSQSQSQSQSHTFFFVSQSQNNSHLTFLLEKLSNICDNKLSKTFDNHFETAKKEEEKGVLYV